MGKTYELFLRVLDLGGPVVVLLMVASILGSATAIFKLWQFASFGVGRHRALQDALSAWDVGDRRRAEMSLGQSNSYLVPVLRMSFYEREIDATRLEAEAESRFAGLENGLRVLETIAHVAPLLGLFGTVLGMIEAFRALQDAGTQVDPSLLAGGIWVALLTTAVGLAVAMPASLLHSWFESRMDADRVLAERAIATALRPRSPL